MRVLRHHYLLVELFQFMLASGKDEEEEEEEEDEEAKEHFT